MSCDLRLQAVLASLPGTPRHTHQESQRLGFSWLSRGWRQPCSSHPAVCLPLSDSTSPQALLCSRASTAPRGLWDRSLACRGLQGSAQPHFPPHFPSSSPPIMLCPSALPWPQWLAQQWFGLCVFVHAVPLAWNTTSPQVPTLSKEEPSFFTSLPTPSHRLGGSSGPLGPQCSLHHHA